MPDEIEERERRLEERLRRRYGETRRKPWLKRLLLWVGVILAVGSLGLWLGRHRITNALIDDALTVVEARAEQVGVRMAGIQSDRIEIPTPWEARVSNLRTEFDLGDPNRNQVRSDFRAETVRASLAGLFPLRARLHLDGFSVRFHPEDVPPSFPFEAFDDASFMSSPLPASDPKAALRIALDRLKALFENNEVDADFNLSGTVELQLGAHGSAKAELYTEEVPGGRLRLRFLKDDLRRVADQAKVDVADEELEIVSLYPIRAPLLLVISAKAKGDAAQKKAVDREFPDDAYRHITWSYHLSRTFGPEFAKQVTDAHETLPNNTPEERAMDYHNNAVARALAAKELSPVALERIILGDPRVIRSPSEVKGWNGLLR